MEHYLKALADSKYGSLWLDQDIRPEPLTPLARADILIANSPVDSSKRVYLIFKGDPGPGISLQLFGWNESNGTLGTHCTSHNTLQIVETIVVSW